MKGITAFRRQNQQKTFLVYAKETSHNPNQLYFFRMVRERRAGKGGRGERETSANMLGASSLRQLLRAG